MMAAMTSGPSVTMRSRRASISAKAISRVRERTGLLSLGWKKSLNRIASDEVRMMLAM